MRYDSTHFETGLDASAGQAQQHADQHRGETRPERNDDNTAALKKLNAKIHGDNRVDAVLASIGDGLYLVRPR